MSDAHRHVGLHSLRASARLVSRSLQNGMRDDERARHIAGDAQRLVHGDRIDARKSLTQRLAAQQFHDDEQRAHVLAVSEHTDDVRTVEVSDRR